MASAITSSRNRATTTPYWSQRYNEKSNSVLKTLFHRELGVPCWGKYGDFSEHLISRQIFHSRTTSEESGKSVKAVKIGLKQQQDPEKNGNKKAQEIFWNQIMISEKTEISITDTRFWVRNKLGGTRGNANVMTKEEFFSVEPSSTFGFKRVANVHTTASGKLKKAFVIGGRALTNEVTTTTLLTLIEPGILRAFDLMKNQVTDELKLPLSLSEGVTAFKEMDVFDNSRKIFVMGSGKKLTKVIIVLNYPPWKEMGVVHVQVPFELSMCEGVCFLVQGKFLQITTWALLMQNVNKNLNGPVKALASEHGLPSVQFEGTLTELPTILSKVHLNSEYCGLVNTNSVPMYYASVKSGMNFFTFHEKEGAVHEFYNSNGDDEDPMEVFLFPDGSSKTLMVTHFSGQSELVEFKSEWKDEINEKVVNVEKINGLNYWADKHNQRSRAAVDVGGGGGGGGGRRPKRNCVNNNVAAQLASKMAIIGMTYCGVMDLIAVLTADEEDFQVAIYEPLKLEAVKALPPVRVWPKVKGSDDVNKRRESISNVEFVFEPEFMFICFHYSAECKPQREVFFARLLSEQH